MVEKQAHLLYYRCCRGVWLSLVERYVRDVEVACSNHVTPIIIIDGGVFRHFFIFHDYFIPIIKDTA